MEVNLYTVSIFLITYFICSINPAIEICKRKTGEDIRNVGDGHAETENVVKVLGRPLGFLVFLIDIGKIFLAYYLAIAVGKIFVQDTSVTLMKSFMIGALLGQCYPIYYSLKGGNGTVAVLVTMFLIDNKIFYVCIIAELLILLITRITTNATVGGTILFAILIFVMMPVYIVPVLVVTAVVIFRHRHSIRRIIEGQEEKAF